MARDCKTEPVLALSVEELAQHVLKGAQRALAKAISITETGGESSRRLMKILYPKSGNAFTIGFTGPTGTGKSSLVDKTIEEYRKRGKRVGVLAIDPSSAFTGGDLLWGADRLMRHTLEQHVFIGSTASI